MKQTIPAVPLLSGLSGLGLLIVAVWLIVAPPEGPPALPSGSESDGTTSIAEAELLEPATFAPARVSASALQAASPFVPDRSVFSRLPAQSGPSQPTYQPELVGLLGSGDDRVVLIIWRPGEQAQRHRLGETTPWGQIVGFESSAIVLRSNAGEEKRLGLFGTQ